MKETITGYESSQLKYEKSFHTDGINFLLRGLFSVNKDKHFRNSLTAPMKNYGGNTATYGLAFSPLAATWGMKTLGVESRSTWKRMAMANILSLGLTYAIGKTIKHQTDAQRPDWTDNNSMPSGHTAMAFASATILHREYGHISPWISVGGYATATATQMLRIRHNHHWVTDTYVGAGIGAISTNLAYFLTDRILGEKGIHPPKLTIDEVERTILYSLRPSSLSLTSGIEWGKENKVKNSTSYHAGITYNHYLDEEWAIDISARLSTCNIMTETNLTDHFDRYHLDLGMRHTWMLSPTLHAGIQLYGGCRYVDNHLLQLNHQVRPEVGGGLHFDFIKHRTDMMGIDCNYQHTFSSWFSNRWVISMQWKILLP